MLFYISYSSWLFFYLTIISLFFLKEQKQKQLNETKTEHHASVVLIWHAHRLLLHLFIVFCLLSD